MEDIIKYLQNLNDFAIGLIATITIITGAAIKIHYRIKKAIRIIFPGIQNDVLWRVLRSFLKTKSLPTPFDISVPVFGYTVDYKEINALLAEEMMVGLMSILHRMRTAESAGGRHFSLEFQDMVGMGKNFQRLHIQWAALLHEVDEIAHIWFVIPDDTPGLAEFRAECVKLTHTRPTFHVVNSPNEAPARLNSIFKKKPRCEPGQVN